MNLYLVSQQEVAGYDTYSSMVVAAIDEKAARRMHPPTLYMPTWNEERGCWWETRRKRFDEYQEIGFNTPDEFVEDRYKSRVWANNEDNIKVVYLGVGHVHLQAGVIVASFHGG